MARKRALSELGLKIKNRLAEKGETQAWLITEISNLTEKYIDNSNLYKIMTGQYRSKEIEAVISKILDIPTDLQNK